MRVDRSISDSELQEHPIDWRYPRYNWDGTPHWGPSGGRYVVELHRYVENGKYVYEKTRFHLFIDDETRGWTRDFFATVLSPRGFRTKRKIQFNTVDIIGTAIPKYDREDFYRTLKYMSMPGEEIGFTP